jgi:mono/diheme cytochrome c family protein
MIAFVLALLAQASIPSPAPIAAGPRPPEEIWKARCTVCHGDDGRSRTKKGRQLKAPNFTSARWQKHTTDDEIVTAITDGIPKHKMPAFKDKLSAEEIASFVPFLRKLAR